MLPFAQIHHGRKYSCSIQCMTILKLSTFHLFWMRYANRRNLTSAMFLGINHMNLFVLTISALLTKKFQWKTSKFKYRIYASNSSTWSSFCALFSYFRWWLPVLLSHIFLHTFRSQIEPDKGDLLLYFESKQIFCEICWSPLTSIPRLCWPLVPLIFELPFVWGCFIKMNRLFLETLSMIFICQSSFITHFRFSEKSYFILLEVWCQCFISSF